ncbi:RAMP superfamily CRISPR-associated protein [Veillonella atypica]|uniref:RAMP superfamily CRISPR-associated protein n=1 Tax=Veillonella atypica TaxID=39777 RepID=UPI00352D1898
MYTLTIKLLSPTMLMSGQGDVNTDSTIIHDRYGIPYIPAKRVRGVLYESALEVAEMMELSKLDAFTIEDVNILFNRSTDDQLVEDNPKLVISNLTIADYDTVANDIAALQSDKNLNKIFIKDRILGEYTSMRYYTSIVKKSGTAREGTLHNSRVLNRNLEFKGHITIDDMTDTERLILSCAVRNLTGIGGKRNRGFGRIECTIDDKVFDLETLGGKLWNK